MTIFFDERLRDVEKDLKVINDTWSQCISMVSDGWKIVKHKCLIIVFTMNSCGAMFMYLEDFSGIEKKGVAIAMYLSYLRSRTKQCPSSCYR